ncbi:UNVERIFIED_CONTAM: hypothetical protein PYX00_001143 [Menopon gallinae]|uniref:BZIP domain-containing protein n=1 Tax=Menopon gallinae TaxID=328185 RepID=A0AAW2IBP5_9NEOP
MQENKKDANLDVNSRKKNLTLDLDSANTFNLRRSKIDMQKTPAPVLTSPDLHKLDLKTPELENLLMQQNHLSETPTPTTSHILFPRQVTEEQADYARGFVEALNELQCSDSSQGASQTIDISNSSSNNSVTYRDLNVTQVNGFTPSLSSYPPLGIIIKDEPQTVPSLSDSPTVSPIDMDTQENLKLERKRLRNRVAASKCRRRKLERIAKLEEKVRLLKGENNELSAYIVKLKDDVCHLKKQVMDHVNRGCQMMSYG